MNALLGDALKHPILTPFRLLCSTSTKSRNMLQQLACSAKQPRLEQSTDRLFSSASSIITENLPSILTSEVLAHSPIRSSSKTIIAKILNPHLQTLAQNPSLITQTLKLLFNSSSHSLLFFSSVLLLPLSPPPSSFDLALSVALRSRNFDYISSLFASLRKFNLPLTPKTYCIVIERFVAHGLHDRAIRFFLSLHRYGLRQDLNMFNMLLDALVKEGMVEKACSFFRVMSGRYGADVISFNIIAEGWCRRKKVGKAVEVMKDVVEMGMEPSISSYNILLKGYFRAGMVRHGLNFFKEMKRRGRNGDAVCRPDVVSYTTVVHGLGIDGQIDKAMKLFDGMIRDGVVPSVASYNALIQVICRGGNIENTVLLFDEMLRKSYTPNSVTYNLVIKGLANAGKMEQAMQFLEKMKLNHIDPNVQTYNILIRGWFEAGEPEKGLELFDNMNKGTCLPNLDTYNVVISAMFVRKKSEDMLIAGKMMVEMIERGHLPRRFMFNRVLNGLLLTGNQSFAKELLRMQDRYGHLQKEFRM